MSVAIPIDPSKDTSSTPAAPRTDRQVAREVQYAGSLLLMLTVGLAIGDIYYVFHGGDPVLFILCAVAFTKMRIVGSYLFAIHALADLIDFRFVSAVVAVLTFVVRNTYFLLRCEVDERARAAAERARALRAKSARKRSEPRQKRRT